MIPLIVVAALALVAIVAVLVQQDRHANQTSHLLAHMASREAAVARERWELNTRIQAPHPQVAAAIPPPPTPSPQELLATLGVLQPGVPMPADDEELDLGIDESHLVGTGPEFTPNPELA